MKADTISEFRCQVAMEIASDVPFTDLSDFDRGGRTDFSSKISHCSKVDVISLPSSDENSKKASKSTSQRRTKKDVLRVSSDGNLKKTITKKPLQV